MAKLIVIRGPLGVGKSTIAKRLSEDLEGEYISIDNILADLKLDVVDEKLGCIPIENFLKVNKSIISRINKFIDNGTPVVIDGNFYHQNQIIDLTDKFPNQSLVFTLTAPVEVCINRDYSRSNPHGEGAARAVYNLVSRFTFGQEIDISNLTVEESVNFIISKINTHE